MKSEKGVDWQFLIGPERLAEDLWALINVPSPTGEEREAAILFSRMLSSAGARVEVLSGESSSPTVIGRLKGKRPGPVFQLAGHIDHVDLPHPLPARDGEIISGRGAADMKGGLAGILSVIRALKESCCDFRGEILVTVYGLHEAPIGNGSALINLIRAGILGDAALVAESASEREDEVITCGKGQAIWDLVVQWSGSVTHELRRPHTADHLLPFVVNLVNTLLRYQQRLVENQSAGLSWEGESLFIGQLHLGDFYNRTATACSLQGTRRWMPGRRLAEVSEEFSQVLSEVNCPREIHLDMQWTSVGESFEMKPGEAVVEAFCSAYEQVMKRRLQAGITAAITDANHLISLGGVPSVQCDFDNGSAHADFEFVRLDRLVCSARVALQTLLNYLQEGDDDGVVV